MRVCLVAEGSYPYITGGMSNWIQQLMLAMPDVEFVVQCITASAKEKKEIRYQFPDNCVEIREIYLQDSDYVSSRKEKNYRMTEEEYEAFEGLLFGENTDWEKLIRFFSSRKISLNRLLMGEDFLQMVQKYYRDKFGSVAFTDFLWTIRSMYLPLFTCMKASPIEADVYHSCSGGYAGVWASMQKCIQGKPFLLSEHGIYTREREEEIIKASWVSGIYKDLWIAQFHKIGACCYQFADNITALFGDARKLQLELGCEEKKTLVIPNGVDEHRFDDRKPRDPYDLFINIGAMIRVTPIKDVKTMINAFAIAKEKEPRLRLWIMGGLDEAPEYVAECKEMLDNFHIVDVEFTGNIKPEDYIDRMDMMILTSLSEGQPLTILEAFAAGKPFIATNVGNNKGLIEGEFDTMGDAGVVVPVMDTAAIAAAILQLAQEPELRQKMGKIGRERAVKYYNDKDCFGRYHSLYQSLCEKGEK